MATLRKYSDLTDDAKRIYDGVCRKLGKINAANKILTSIQRSTTKYDEATRRAAGDKSTRLYHAKWALEAVRYELLGCVKSWIETGVPVRVGDGIRNYAITRQTQFGHVSLTDEFGVPKSGTVDLGAWPTDTDDLFRILGLLEKETLAAAEAARKKVDRRDEGLKPKKDPIAHWKEIP